jgi:hypothetical protein
MHGRGDDENEERRRQELERQRSSFEDQIYGNKRTTATGAPDGRHELRELRVKAVPLRVRLDIHAALRLAMKEAGYNSFPKFFEWMLADYLERYPLKPESAALLPSSETLQQQYLKKRDEDDAK